MHEGDSSATKRSMTDVGVKHCTIFIIVADESIRSHPCYLSLHAFYWLVMLSLKLTLIWIHWWHYFFFKVVHQHSSYCRYILFPSCSGFLWLIKKIDDIDVFLWYYMGSCYTDCWPHRLLTGFEAFFLLLLFQ